MLNATMGSLRGAEEIDEPNSPGRMVELECKGDEYKSTVLYLLSEARKYMTNSIKIVDGGRTCW